MDSINSFDIRLEKDVYFPGELLNGIVIIDLIEPIKLRGIRVFLRGRARVQWKILKSGESKILKDDQYLIDNKVLLWGKQKQQLIIDNKNEVKEEEEEVEVEEENNLIKQQQQQQLIQILPKGIHELSFSFELPSTQLPCSLETKTGTIRYYVKVLVDMPYASSPQGIKYFTLIGPYIDCLEEKYLSPLTGQDHKIRCQPCCRRGVVALRAILERSAYCCGEQLKLNLHLENRQEYSTQICIRLIQNLEYRIDKVGLPIETKTIQSTVLEWRSQFVLKHSQLNINSNNLNNQSILQLPTIPPTMIGFCRLIQLYYILKISVDQGPRFNKNQKFIKNNINNSTFPSSSTYSSSSSSTSSTETCIEMDFPLIIATVPFRENNLQIYNVIYDFCVNYIETGKYISPEFRLGQVWDGRENEEENKGNNNLNIEEIILYRPVYVKIIGEQQILDNNKLNISTSTIYRRQSNRIIGIISNNNNNELFKKDEQLLNGGAINFN